jgi:type IV secretory pathway VirB2 component (pilin)
MQHNHLNPFQRLVMSPQTFMRLSTAAAMLVLIALTPAAHAQSGGSFDLPLINTVGCAVIKWMSGPLAIVIFLMVTVATFVIGIFAKMDWTRILSVVIIYGILQGIISGALNLGVINPPAGCLR